MGGVWIVTIEKSLDTKNTRCPSHGGGKGHLQLSLKNLNPYEYL